MSRRWATRICAPLESDIETVARNVSSWIRTCPATEQVAADIAEAVEVAQKAPQKISTLILPADVSWGEGGEAVKADLNPVTTIASETLINQIADVLLTRGKKTAILLGRRVLLEEGLVAAAKIAEMASVQLSGYDHLVIIDTMEPVSFFAYPGKKSYLVPDKCTVHKLVEPDQDALGSLHALVEAIGAAIAGKSSEDSAEKDRSYAILNIELKRVGAKGAGPKAKSQLDLSKTEIDFVAMAKGMGMPSETATTAKEFNDALERAYVS